MQRVVGVLNDPPEEVVKAGGITAFKIRVCMYMDRKGLDGYRPNVGKLQKLSWDIISIDELGTMACFRAAQFPDTR